MNGNCHFVYAAGVTGMVALNADKISVYLPNITSDREMIALLIMGGLIGGIFPDIDNPKSYFGQLSKPVSTVIGKIGEGIGKTGSHHRGIFHDFSLYLAGLVLSYFYAPFLIGFFLGAVSHLFLDMFNPAGVPVLFGISKIHLGKIKADSKQAIGLTYLMIAFTILIGVWFKFSFKN